METLVAELKECRAEGIDKQVTHYLAGYNTMKADQQKTLSTWCIKLMHACQAVVERLNEPQRASAVRAVTYCYGCIGTLNRIVELKDVLTVAKIAYHITSKLLNLGDLRTALSCSDCIRGELLRCAAKAVSAECDNIAQNVSAALWNHGRAALGAFSIPSCAPSERTDKITLAASLLGRSLCFAALVRSVDCQLLVANLERITSKVTQCVLTEGASLDPQIAFRIATSLYSDICALPWLSVKPCLRLLTCVQSTAFLVQCGKPAEALTCLEPCSWGFVPQQAQQMCPVVPSAWAAMTAGLRLYSVVASDELRSLHCLAGPTQERKDNGSTSLDDLTAALDTFCSVARPVGLMSERLISGDDDKLLLCMAIVEPVRLLLETLRNKLSLQTPQRERCFFPCQPLVTLITSFLNVLRLYHNLLFSKLDLSSRLPCVQSGSELKRILVKRLQQAAKTVTLSASFLVDAVVLLDTHPPAAGTVAWITPETHVTSAAVHTALGHLASLLETSAAKEPEILKELSYIATILHNSGVRLLSRQQLDDATQLLQISLRMYKICYHAKGSSDNQEKWRSTILSLSECYQHSGAWAAALKLTSELFSAGFTTDKCIQIWTGVKRCCVKQSALVATDEGLNSFKAPNIVTSVLTTTLREAFKAHQPDVSEAEIVDLLLSELRSYIVCSYTSKSCASSFRLAEMAVIKDLLLSHAVTGCNRAFVLLRQAQLRQVLPATVMQFEASSHGRLSIEECEAALSMLLDDIGSDTVDDLTALAYFLGYAIQHPLPAITLVPDVGRSHKKDTSRKGGQLCEDPTANACTSPRRSLQQPVCSQNCSSLNLLDLALGSWKRCFTNGRTVFCEFVTLSCLGDSASVFALHDMPVQELECLLLVERSLRQGTTSHTDGGTVTDPAPEWRHEQQALALARLISVSLRLGMLDDAADHVNRLRNLNGHSMSLKVPCHVGDRVSTLTSLSEAEWLLASGRVEEAVSKADGVLSSMDSKATSLTPSRCLYIGAASRLLASAGSEHAAVCLPRGISVLEHAHEAVRMHSSLYGFVAGKHDSKVNAFGCSSVAIGDVSFAIAARELLVSLDHSSVVHLLVEDVRAVRCYSREGLSLSRISLPLRAVSFLLHLSRSDSLCGAHSDCQVRLGSAARLLNAVASDGRYCGVASSEHPDVVVTSWRGSSGVADATSERLICTYCNGQLAERSHQSVASECSNDSDESFIRSKPLNVAGLGMPAAGIIGDDEDDSCTSPGGSWVDLSKDATASPRLVLRSRPPDGLVAAAEHSLSCSCTVCGGDACGGRLVGLLERLVMHGVRQAEAALAESEIDAAVNFARGALRAVEHYAAKADRWSAVDLSPSGARLAAEVVFAAPALAAGRVLLESAMSLSCAYDAALADWKRCISRNAAGRLADLYLSRLAEAEVLICLMSIASHLVPLLRAVSTLSASESVANCTAAACTDGAFSPCSGAQPAVIAPHRQKVQKSRLKKAVHFDDSEMQSEDVRTSDRDKLADTAGRMFSTVRLVSSRSRRSTSDHRDAKRIPLLRKDAPDDTGDHENPGFGVQPLLQRVPTERVSQLQGRKSRIATPNERTVAVENRALLRRAEGNLVPSVSCQSDRIASECRRLEDLLLKFRHFPPVAAYRAANLVLAAAYHHLGNDSHCARHLCESMALTFRYAAQRNYARKQRKAARIAGSSSLPEWKILQLSRCYELSKFGTFDSSFDTALERLPEGWTVCQLSVVQLPHCVEGYDVNTLYITRLQRGKTPVVCLIPNFHSVGKELVDEFADIMTCSTESMLLSDYKAWWAERTRLDQRMKRLVQRLEQQLLGCWKGALLGSPRDTTTVTMEGSATRLPAFEDLRIQFMSVTGLSELHFQVFLDGAATCSKKEVLYSLTRLVPRTGENRQEEVDSLGRAAEELADRLVATAGSLYCEASSDRYPTLLVIDKKLQHLPWESMTVLRAKSVSRIPSLSFIGTHLTYHSLDAQSIVTDGIDDRKVYYVLNPDGNLLKTEETFKSWFESEKGWSGIVGQEPSGQQLTAALTEADVFLYCGHGSGSKYLDGESIQTLLCRPASILMGCSSGALLARGSLDATGVVQNYLMGGCPCVIANLWDVTDRDIDRFLTALLRHWLNVDPAIADSLDCSPLPVIDQRNLLACVGRAREACKLRYMIGASPVVYGLPVSRK